MPKSTVTDSNASHFGLLQREMTFFGRWGGAREEILTGSDWERRGSDLSVTRLPRPKPCHMAYFIPNRQNEHHADVKWEVGSFISESSGVAPCWPLERMQFLRHFCTGFTFRPESSPPPPTFYSQWSEIKDPLFQKSLQILSGESDTDLGFSERSCFFPGKVMKCQAPASKVSVGT